MDEFKRSFRPPEDPDKNVIKRLEQMDKKVMSM